MSKERYADLYAPLDDCLAELFRRMTIEQKFALHERMNQNLRLFIYERLKQFHPDWTELELRRELLRWLLGMELPKPALGLTLVTGSVAGCRRDESTVGNDGGSSCVSSAQQ